MLLSWRAPSGPSDLRRTLRGPRLPRRAPRGSRPCSAPCQRPPVRASPALHTCAPRPLRPVPRPTGAPHPAGAPVHASPAPCRCSPRALPALTPRAQALRAEPLPTLPPCARALRVAPCRRSPPRASPARASPAPTHFVHTTPRAPVFAHPLLSCEFPRSRALLRLH